VAYTGSTAYAASKYGLRGMHEVLRAELSRTGVRTTLVSPGPVDTPIWDAVDPDAKPGFTKRRDMMRAEDVAAAVRYAVEQPASRIPHPVDAETLQALLDLSGPGGYIVLVGAAARHAVGLAGLMGGIHFIGINAPADVEELPILSLLVCPGMIPLRRTIARGAVVGSDRLGSEWLAEARRVVLPGRRVVIEGENVPVPVGLTRLA